MYFWTLYLLLAVPVEAAAVRQASVQIVADNKNGTNSPAIGINQISSSFKNSRRATQGRRAGQGPTSWASTTTYSRQVELVLDMATLYAAHRLLKAFLVYAPRKNRSPLLRWLKGASQNLPVQFFGCPSPPPSFFTSSYDTNMSIPSDQSISDAFDPSLFPHHDEDRRDYALMVLFCDRAAQTAMLREAVRRQALRPAHWLLLQGADNPPSLLPIDVFIPLDSLVLEAFVSPNNPTDRDWGGGEGGGVGGSGDGSGGDWSVTLRDVWSPGVMVPHRSYVVGIYRSKTNAFKVKEEFVIKEKSPLHHSLENLVKALRPERKEASQDEFNSLQTEDDRETSSANQPTFKKEFVKDNVTRRDLEGRKNPEGKHNLLEINVGVVNQFNEVDNRANDQEIELSKRQKVTIAGEKVDSSKELLTDGTIAIKSNPPNGETNNNQRDNRSKQTLIAECVECLPYEGDTGKNRSSNEKYWSNQRMDHEYRPRTNMLTTTKEVSWPKDEYGELKMSVTVESKRHQFVLNLNDDSIYRRRKDLTGIHFIATTLNDSKAHNYYYDKQQGRYIMGGLFGDIFEMMRADMNFTYSVIAPADGEFGAQLDNGSWTGLVGEVTSQRADIVVAFLSKTQSRYEAVSYASRILNFRYRFYAMAPSSSGLMWKAYTRPFSAKLWGFVLVVFLVMSASFSIASYGCTYIEAVERIRALRRGEVDVRKAQSPGDKLKPTRQGALSMNSGSERGGRRFTFETQANMTEVEESGHSLSAFLAILQDTYERHDAASSENQIRRRTTSARKIPYPVSNVENFQGSRFDTWFQDSLLLVWSSFMQQGWPCTPSKAILRLIFWTSYCTGVILLASYSATLVSFLTVVDKSLPFDSFETLSALDNYRLGIQLGSVSEEFLTSPALSKYYDRLVAPHTDTLSLNYSALRETAARNPKFVIIGTYEVQRSSFLGACSLAHTAQNIMYNDGAFAFFKDSPNVPLFSYYIDRLRESGLLQRMVLLYYPSQYTCPETIDMAMGFEQVFTAFLVLMGGVALACVVLMMEAGYQYTMRAKSSRQLTESAHH